MEDVKTRVENLPFDAKGLFNEKTDGNLEELHKMKKTAKSYSIQQQPKYNKYQWRKPYHQYLHSAQPYKSLKNQNQT